MKDTKKNKDILKAANKRMAEAITADYDNRIEAMDDLEKLVGDQWPETIKAQREADDKPCLTINRLPQFVRQVTGDIRRMNPANNVTPADSAATKETAEIIEGLIRQIEYRSDASSVYEKAAESAAGSSIGWFRILNDWEDDSTFDQEILIKGIRNPFSVYCDPKAEMPTREDASYVFITEQMPNEEFEEAYPKDDREDVDYDGCTDGRENWAEEGQTVVAEYYWKEPVKKKIALLRNGQVVEEKDIVEGLDIVKRRDVETHKVMWAKISGSAVLEGPKEVPSMYIPVVAVTGEEWHVGDKVHRSSVIRYAKDPQQMYNYWRSASTEIVALQPKAPYMVTAKQVAGLEAIWNQANRSNRPYLVYNPDEKAERPQRSQPPVASSGMFQEIMAAADDMKATTGIYDAGLGNSSSENSGVAIRQRQMEGDISTSIYSDNMAKAIATAGRIIIDMIPKIYDTRRVIRILGKDGSEKMETINDISVSLDGAVPVNDMTIGKYDVRVQVGPNYSTKRQETAEGMLEFIRTVPGAAQITSDLIAKSMDWPDADQFADRLKKTLPPEFRDQQDLSPEEQQAAQQQQMQQQQMDQIRRQFEELEFRTKSAEASEAEADASKSAAEANKTAVEAAQAQFELALQSGQINDAIGLIVQEQVARALQGALGPMMGR